MLLPDKICVVTGAASERGLGMATAKLFAANGAKVAILDLDAEASKRAAASIGPDHIGIACDVTSKPACEAAVAAVIARFGRIDVLVNNAGITQPIKTLDITPADYEAVTDVSLRGTLYMSQSALPAAFSAWTMARDSVVGNSQSLVNDTTQNRVSVPRNASARTPS